MHGFCLTDRLEGDIFAFAGHHLVRISLVRLFLHAFRQKTLYKIGGHDLFYMLARREPRVDLEKLVADTLFGNRRARIRQDPKKLHGRERRRLNT